MVINQLKIAWRSLKKQPFFTFLNTFGLAVGMAGALLIGLYIYDELSYDKMFVDANRIHRVNADIKFGGEVTSTPEVSAPMAKALMTNLPQVELATRFRNIGSVLIKKSDAPNNVKESGVTYAETSMFSMLGLNLLYGDKTTALDQPNTMVISRSLAEKFFPINEALGQTMVLEDDQTYTVSGVIEDLPKNSFLQDRKLLLAMPGYADAQAGEWTSHNYYTLIKMKPGNPPSDIQKGMDDMIDTYVIPYAQRYFPGVTREQFEASGNYIKYSTIPLTDIHLYSHRYPEFSQNSDIKNLYVLGVIGLFLIVLASINFMNLSTAQSLKRAKEVGIRKTLGSPRLGLVRQFLTESGLITFGSLLLALIISSILLPFFNVLSNKALQIPFTNPWFWGILLVATFLLGLASGSYPAFFMSRFVPVKVLKGSGDKSIGGGRTRNFLVVFQFAISIFLIVATLVVYQQLRYIKNKDVGFGKDQVLVINNVYSMSAEKRQTFKRAVKGLAQIQNATLSSYLPTPSSRSDTSFLRAENRDQEKAINMQEWQADYDYVTTLGLEIIAGRNFDPQFASDSTAILLNETAVSILESTPEDILGKQLVYNIVDQGQERIYTVIGVIKNFHFESLRNDISALSIMPGNFASRLNVKLKEGSISQTIAQIEGIWDEMAPGQPFSYYFLDDSFNDSYEAEQLLGQIFMAFTVLSILIACLGLFGLTAFNAQKRVKEIGIRKVLGASVSQITLRLSFDFLRLVGIAILVALPLGWFAMDRWLEDFAFRVSIPWWALLLSGVLAVFIALVTVSYQSINAAIANPVKSLRTE
ncbi:MAG: ABC transporter permease [Bacteroidota bacterium]